MPLQKRSVNLLKSSGPMMLDLILDVMNGFWQLRDAHTESAKTPLHRHFVPGYYRAVPPGRKPFSHRSASHYLSAYEVDSLVRRKNSSERRTRFHSFEPSGISRHNV
jgi:hypothetical protein